MAKNPLIYAMPGLIALAAAAFAADSPPEGAELQRQLADAQDKLSTSLHSYSLLEAQLSQAKADADKGAADKAALSAQLEEAKRVNAELRTAAMAAGQLDSLRTQLRQSQDALAALAAENSQLRLRLAAAGPAPMGGTAPTRPGGEGAAAGPLTPVPIPVPSPDPGPPPAAGASAGPATSAQTPAQPSQPRIHVVVAGDSLTRISQKYYGTANRYDEILAANRDVVRDENHLIVGMKLKIP